jgi:hypothetical protein
MDPMCPQIPIYVANGGRPPLGMQSHLVIDSYISYSLRNFRRGSVHLLLEEDCIGSNASSSSEISSSLSSTDACVLAGCEKLS